MWAIGVLAYALLTGTLPFTNANPNEMAKALKDFKDHDCSMKPNFERRRRK